MQQLNTNNMNRNSERIPRGDSTELAEVLLRGIFNLYVLKKKLSVTCGFLGRPVLLETCGVEHETIFSHYDPIYRIGYPGNDAGQPCQGRPQPGAGISGL